jgi:hypothetical protein
LSQSLNDPVKVAAANKLLKSGDESVAQMTHDTRRTSTARNVVPCAVMHSRSHSLCAYVFSFSFSRKRNKQLMGMLKNGVDIIIPSARLGWLPVSDGTVGLAGTITSVIGIVDTWPASK